MLRWHTHGWIDRRRWSWTVGRAGRTRIVLRATPTETYARVSDGISLHLIDGHLGSVTLDELNKAAALAGWNLDVGDLAKALEEGAQLILGHVAGKATDENGSIVWVGELIHGLRGSKVAAAEVRSAHRVHAHGCATTSGHTTHSGTRAAALVLGSCGADAHRAVAAVDSLHFSESALLLGLVGEPDEPIATRESADGVGHDLGRFAGVELGLEERKQDVFVHLRSQVADEDGVFRSAVITRAVGETTTRGPVQLELTVGVGNDLSVELECSRRRFGVFEINEAVTGITSTR